MSQATPPQQGKPRWTGVAIALFVIGLVILLTTGLCTLIAIAVYPLGILVYLLLGGVPMAMGGVLVWGALKARRRD